MGGSLSAHESSEHVAVKEAVVDGTEAPHAPEKFRAGKMIMEHILDAHEWHLMTIGDHHITIPLPIILYSPSKGLSAFMSSRFEHGHASYEGYRMGAGHIISEDGSEFYDLSITKNTASMLVSMIILAFIFISVANTYKRNPARAPKGLQSLLEPIIIFIRDEVAKPSIGPKYQKYLPYLLTVFFFIWINNLMGLVPIPPFGANVTGNIAITLSLATLTFLITLFSGNKHYWRHIFAMPGVPGWVLILLTPIEILGVFLRPFVLMIRLFANIAAGHIIALSFFSLIFIFAEINTGLGFGVSVVSVAFTVFMACLELLVAFLQAYVFTLLSAIYFGAAVEDHHHHDHHAEEEKPAVV